jgi:Family of unknown function (DUF5330)
MKFILKAAFWLTIVLSLLPTGKEGEQSAAAGAPISATEAVSAASATMSDMRQFCTRQPDACAVGASAAITLGHKAQAGAKMLYEYLNDKLGPRETGSIATNSGTSKAAASTGKPSQNTLAPADMTPAWRGPQPRKEAENRRPA